MAEEQPSPHLGAPGSPRPRRTRPGHRPLQASQGAPCGSRAAARQAGPASRSREQVPSNGFQRPDAHTAHSQTRVRRTRLRTLPSARPPVSSHLKLDRNEIRDCGCGWRQGLRLKQRPVTLVALSACENRTAEKQHSQASNLRSGGSGQQGQGSKGTDGSQTEASDTPSRRHTTEC